MARAINQFNDGADVRAGLKGTRARSGETAVSGASSRAFGQRQRKEKKETPNEPQDEGGGGLKKKIARGTYTAELPFRA